MPGAGADLERVHHSAHRAVMNPDILGSPVSIYGILDAQAVVRAGNKAVIHFRMAAPGDINPVRVRHMPVIVNHCIADKHMVAGLRVQSPAHRIMQDDVFNDDVFAAQKPDHRAGSPQHRQPGSVLVLSVSDSVPVEGADRAGDRVDLRRPGLCPRRKHGHRKGRQRRFLPRFMDKPFSFSADPPAAGNGDVPLSHCENKCSSAGFLAEILRPLHAADQVLRVSGGDQLTAGSDKQGGMAVELDCSGPISAAGHQHRAAPGVPAGFAGPADRLRIQQLIGLSAIIPDVKNWPVRRNRLIRGNVFPDWNIRIIVPRINVSQLRIRYDLFFPPVHIVNIPFFHHNPHPPSLTRGRFCQLF